MDPDDPDLDVLRRAWRSLSDGFEALQAGDLTPIAEYWSPELVIEHADAWPVPGTYEGYDGFQRWFAETFGGDYSGYETIAYQVERVGGELFVLADSRWNDADGAELVFPKFAVLFSLRGRRICRMRVYLDPGRAVAAALD